MKHFHSTRINEALAKPPTLNGVLSEPYPKNTPDGRKFSLIEGLMQAKNNPPSGFCEGLGTGLKSGGGARFKVGR